MKGFVNVLNTDIKKAIEKHLVVLGQTTIIRNEATLAYYDKYYTNAGWWTRWFHRKLTPGQFFYYKTEGIWFVNHDKILSEFLSEEECSLLEIISYGDKDKREGLASLLAQTDSETCVLGEEYCAYVSKYKDIKL